MNSAPAKWSCMRGIGSDSVLLELHVIPNAKRTEVCGLHDQALKLRLAAPPVEGQANDALVLWLSQQLGLPRRSIVLKRGASSRRKQLLLQMAPERLQLWLDGCLAQRGGSGA